MLRFIVLNFLFAMIPVGVTAWVAYIVSDKSRRKKQLLKYKNGSNKEAYRLYKKFYSRKSLTAWLLISTSQVIDFAGDVYKAFIGHGSGVIAAISLLSFVCLITGTSILFTTLKIRRPVTD